jgi:hypothetical protein
MNTSWFERVFSFNTINTFLKPEFGPCIT